jgi:hypothetical protein
VELRRRSRYDFVEIKTRQYAIQQDARLAGLSQPFSRGERNITESVLVAHANPFQLQYQQTLDGISRHFAASLGVNRMLAEATPPITSAFHPYIYGYAALGDLVRMRKFAFCQK